jgi:hypothetical protein
MRLDSTELEDNIRAYIEIISIFKSIPALNI